MGLKRLNEAEMDIWPAFSDFLSSVLFVLVLFVFGIFFTNVVKSLLLNDESYTAMRRRQDEVRDELKKTLGDAVKIESNGNLQRIILQVDGQGQGGVLFDSGSATLKEAGQERLNKVVEALKKAGKAYDTIQVEGHTDSDPIQTAQFFSNWELSAARAGAVVNYLNKLQFIEPWRLSANGRGEYRPYQMEESKMSSPSDTSSGLPEYVRKSNLGDPLKQRNRRIEIILTYKVGASAPL